MALPTFAGGVAFSAPGGLQADGHEYLFDIEADARERANRAPLEPQRLAAMREDWLRWSESMLPIPPDASISLGYGARDMPQR